MRVFAYCCASYATGTRRAAGVEPLLSPPVSAEQIAPDWLEGYDLLYFDLHGEPGQPFWWGDEGTVALTAALIRQADLSGAVVFALNCYLADEDSPMLEALLAAGARYVVGGDGENWAGRRTIYGAALLGQRFRLALAWGMDPLKALAVAKRAVRVKAGLERVLGRKKLLAASKDTLAFKAYNRRT